MSLEAGFGCLVCTVPDVLKSRLAVIIPCFLKVEELLQLGICVKTGFWYGINCASVITLLVNLY